ncbi:MAG TPA: hypothetical protein VKQ36_01820, partial [Ktedonobacterales bacterium]|nr:hypothetical protein [Ktedonobacterales bacterium]
MRDIRASAGRDTEQAAPSRSGGGPLGWWYRLAAPPDPPPGASLAERERARRGRLAATLLLGFIVLTLFGLPIGLTDPATLYSLLASYVISAIMVLLNRSGQVAITAVMLAAISDGVFVIAILGAPHGLELIYTPLFDLMVIAELFAVSLLPPASVFVVAVINTAIILAIVQFMPHAANFPADSSPDFYTTLIRPIVLHFIIAVVSYLWVTSSLNALRRADRAEEIAALERREIERTRSMEQGVRTVLATHVQLANGNFNARVP